MIAHVLFRDGVPVTEHAYFVWRALRERGWEVRSFDDLDDVELDPAQPVIGGIEPVYEALRRLDVVPPDIDYPDDLRPYLVDPDVRRVTMGWVRQHPEAWPVFVKPTTGRKEFTGLVVRSTHDLLATTLVDDDAPVFVAHPVDMSGRVEWRAFVIDGEVRDIRPYSGCPDVRAPSRVFVQSLVDQWPGCPAGASIDVVDLGTPGAPDWRVVECNDGYALGAYGLIRSVYAELVVKRWGQLTGVRELW